MKVYLGTTKNDELIYLEWDKINNKQRKVFSLKGGSYSNPLTEEEGEQRAKDILKEGEEWKMAVKGNYTTQGLKDWSKQVLNVDGWRNVLRDIEDFGEHENETIYLNFSSCGQHQEEIKNFKNLWVEKKDLKEVYKIWNTKHLKPLTEECIKIMENFFRKYKRFCLDQKALNQYLKDIEY